MKKWDFTCSFDGQGALWAAGGMRCHGYNLCPSCVDWLSRHDFSPKTSTREEMLTILKDQP